MQSSANPSPQTVAQRRPKRQPHLDRRLPARAEPRRARLRPLPGRRRIGHKRTRPYTPQTNGKVERYQQTLGREWEKGLTYNTSADRRAALAHWLEHYNTHRRHSGIANMPPLTCVHNLLGQNN
ncbi:MAG: integrase core domain-containing protein [Actinobacteria bacterium]|nr:integrase core domain-containing protein [Actinomycetota bacterium]